MGGSPCVLTLICVRVFLILSGRPLNVGVSLIWHGLRLRTGFPNVRNWLPLTGLCLPSSRLSAFCRLRSKGGVAMSDIKRVSVSMPAELADDLDYISRRLGISRSGLVSQLLLAGDISHLRTLLQHIPEQPTEGDLKRFRGDSKAYIAEKLSELQRLQGGLFDDSAN